MSKSIEIQVYEIDELCQVAFENASERKAI